MSEEKNPLDAQEEVEQIIKTAKALGVEVDETDVERGFQWFKNLLGERLLFDSRMLTPDTLKNQIRLYLAINLVNENKGFDFLNYY